MKYSNGTIDKLKLDKKNKFGYLLICWADKHVWIAERENELRKGHYENTGDEIGFYRMYATLRNLKLGIKALDRKYHINSFLIYEVICKGKWNITDELNVWLINSRKSKNEH